MLRLATIALLALAACPSSPPPTTSPTPTPTPMPDPTPAPTPSGTAELTSQDACTADADCTITMFSGCCACPGCDQPSARSTTTLAASQDQCKAVRCDMERCKVMLCKQGDPATSFVAKCESNVCVGHRK
ncbi:MAG: hypothetical protein ACKV2T_26635 [Kofleriaceae bacterium]